MSSYQSNSWLPLDLLRQVRGLLRARFGGTGNAQGWGRGTIFAGWNATGATLELGTLVKYTGFGNMVEPTAAASDSALGIVVGYLDGGGVLHEADAVTAGSVAVLLAGVTSVTLANDVSRGDLATPSSTAGAAGNDASGTTFGRYLEPGTSGDQAQVLILGGSSRAAPVDATYLVTTASGTLTSEVVVGATPGGELGGTWPSPTVDTTHSGSSHADATTAAETYSDAALAAHDSDVDAAGTSHHHTLGTTATTAAAGNHKHSSLASSGAIYGSGIDGAIDLDGTNTYSTLMSKSGSVYSLTRDLQASSLRVRAGVTLKPAGFKIYCAGTLTIDSGSPGGVIDRAGVSSTGQAGGSSSPNGTGATLNTGQAGASGNAGSAGGSAGSNAGNLAQRAQAGTGGGGGGYSGATGASNGGVYTINALEAFDTLVTRLTGMVFAISGTASVSGGTGGGSGGCISPGSSGASGGGGGGGGALVIVAQSIVNDGTITCAGGNGGNGALNGGTTGAGGGGGGGGGVLSIVTDSLTGSGTITVAGGTHGSGAGTGGDGQDGNPGRYLLMSP